jgi:hypothetical protein
VQVRRSQANHDLERIMYVVDPSYFGLPTFAVAFVSRVPSSENWRANVSAVMETMTGARRSIGVAIELAFLVTATGRRACPIATRSCGKIVQGSYPCNSCE